MIPVNVFLIIMRSQETIHAKFVTIIALIVQQMILQIVLVYYIFYYYYNYNSLNI